MELEPLTQKEHGHVGYTWKYGARSGQLIDVPSSKEKMFIAVLHELGFGDVKESDLLKSIIEVEHLPTRHVLSYHFNPKDIHVDRVYFYIDQCILQPVTISLTRTRVRFDSDRNEIYKSFVYFNEKRRGDIDHSRDVRDIDCFRMALKVLDFTDFKLGQFKRGTIHTGDTVQQILVFKP